MTYDEYVDRVAAERYLPDPEATFSAAQDAAIDKILGLPYQAYVDDREARLSPSRKARSMRKARAGLRLVRGA